MRSIEPPIQCAEKLTSIFGYWPSFHDAEVIELNFWRGSVDPDAARYVFPVLTVKVHVWEITREVNPQGYLVLQHHTLATLRFHDVVDFRMEGFNHQNQIFGLAIDAQPPFGAGHAALRVQFEPAFGMSASFRCCKIEVLDAVRCSADGISPV